MIMIRILDFIFSLCGLIFLSPVFLIIYGLIWRSGDAPLFRQQRVGRHQKPFVLIKFRTMSMDTASVASHLVKTSAITPMGHFLRRTKLDELPQLWNVLKGEMSLVGPRPCLPSQTALIEARAQRHIFNVRPGITGLAQLQRIDMSTPELLAVTEEKMLKNYHLGDYFRYLVRTVLGGGAGDAAK